MLRMPGEAAATIDLKSLPAEVTALIERLQQQAIQVAVKTYAATLGSALAPAQTSPVTSGLAAASAAASAAVSAAGSPVRLALDTASGPVSLSSSRAIALSGMRTATVPFVSPRSHVSVGRAGTTMVSPPGQNAETSARTSSGTDSASASGRSLSGTVDGDDVSLTGGTASFADKRVGQDKVVTLIGVLLGDFAPGRWAWILADAAPTTERCPACWGAIPRAVPGHCVDIDGAWWHAPGDCVLCDCCDALCEVCRGAGRCAPIPARGRQRAWEWTP